MFMITKRKNIMNSFLNPTKNIFRQLDNLLIFYNLLVADPLHYDKRFNCAGCLRNTAELIEKIRAFLLLNKNLVDLYPALIIAYYVLENVIDNLHDFKMAFEQSIYDDKEFLEQLIAKTDVYIKTLDTVVQGVLAIPTNTDDNMEQLLGPPEN